MSFILTSQEFDYLSASKFSFKTLKKQKKRRHFLDNLQPLHTNKQLDYELEISIVWSVDEGSARVRLSRIAFESE